MASLPIYEFYAELIDYEPKMWRRFQVMNNVTMARLAYILIKKLAQTRDFSRDLASEVKK